MFCKVEHAVVGCFTPWERLFTLKACSQNFALTDDGGVAHHSDNNSLVNKDLYWSYTVTDVLEFQTLGPVDTAWPVTDHYITLH